MPDYVTIIFCLAVLIFGFIVKLALIARQSTDVSNYYKCRRCNEGFVAEKQLIAHQKTCSLEQPQTRRPK